MEIIKRLHLKSFAKQAAKLIVCIILCFCLIFAYSYKEPAHAAPVVGVGGAIVIGLCMAALGVTISAAVGNPAAQAFFQDLADKSNGLINDFTNQVKTGTENIVNVTKEQLQYVGDTLKAGWSAAEDIKKYEKIWPYGWNFDNPKLDAVFYEHAFQITPIGQFYVPNNSTIYSHVTFLGFVTRATEGLGGSQKWQSNIMLDGQLNVQMDSYYSGVAHFKIGSDTKVYEGTSVPGWNNISTYGCTFGITQFIFAKVTLLDGDIRYALLWPGGYQILEKQTDSTIPSGAFPLPMTAWNYNGKSVGVPGETTEQVIQRLTDRISQLEADGTRSYPLVNTGSNTQIDNNTRTQTQTDTAGQEVATEAEKDASEAANEGQDTSTPKPIDMPDLSLPMLITKKFPFSLPFDLYNAFGNLVAPSKPPVYTINFLNVPALHWNYSVTLDLTPYDKLATVSRWGFSLLFIIGLILITRKLIGA